MVHWFCRRWNNSGWVRDILEGIFYVWWNPNGGSTSAPSTPCVTLRRKPPPKPPRIRSIFEPLGPNSQGALPYHSCGPASPDITVTSQRVESLKSSLAYATNTLDRSVAKNDRSGSLVMNRIQWRWKIKYSTYLCNWRTSLYMRSIRFWLLNFCITMGWSTYGLSRNSGSVSLLMLCVKCYWTSSAVKEKTSSKCCARPWELLKGTIIWRISCTLWTGS